MFKENQKLIWNDIKNNRKVNAKFREPYGEKCSIIYLYTKEWKSFGDKLVNNIDLEEVKED